MVVKGRSEDVTANQEPGLDMSVIDWTLVSSQFIWIYVLAWRRISRKNEKERAGGAGGSGLVAVMPVGGEQIEEGFGKSDIPKGLIEEMRRSEKRAKEELAKSTSSLSSFSLGC